MKAKPLGPVLPALVEIVSHLQPCRMGLKLFTAMHKAGTVSLVDEWGTKRKTSRILVTETRVRAM